MNKFKYKYKGKKRKKYTYDKDKYIRDKLPIFNNTNRIVSIHRIFKSFGNRIREKTFIESALIDIVLNEVLLYFIALYRDLDSFDSYTNGTETVRLFLILSLSLIPYTNEIR